MISKDILYCGVVNTYSGWFAGKTTLSILAGTLTHLAPRGLLPASTDWFKYSAIYHNYPDFILFCLVLALPGKMKYELAKEQNLISFQYSSKTWSRRTKMALIILSLYLNTNFNETFLYTIQDSPSLITINRQIKFKQLRLVEILVYHHRHSTYMCT